LLAIFFAAEIFCFYKKTIQQKMEVLDPRTTLIYNQEVLSLLNQAKIQQKYNRGSQNHNTIVYEASKYLNDTNATLQKRENIVDLINSLKKFKLTGAEVFFYCYF